jgi:endonuclease YncB( thermonuclease family)
LSIRDYRKSRFKPALPSAIILLATAIAAHAGEYKVSRVIDSDTIEVRKGTIKLTVRLVGIDAPEESHKK